MNKTNASGMSRLRGASGTGGTSDVNCAGHASGMSGLSDRANPTDTVDVETIRFRVRRDAPGLERVGPGDPVDLSQVAEYAAKAEREFCRADAMSLLARTENSELQLRLKLHKRRYSEETIGTVLLDLRDAGLQSDRRYAESLVRSYVPRRAIGPYRVLAKLKEKGVEESLAWKAIQEHEQGQPDCWDQALDRALRRMADRGSVPKSRLVSRLISRGFSKTQVKKIFA